jgi:hypothetical protein
VRCFCVVQKKKGVADAMIEAHFLKIYIKQIPENLSWKGYALIIGEPRG